MIKVEKINKSFGNQYILKNITFSINKGDSLAIIGQSGVGKSVLIKHINGLIFPDSGKIWVDKHEINIINYNKLQKIRKKMSMVFQFGALFDSMNIEENISLGLRNITNYNQSKIHDVVDECLQMVNLNDINNLMPSDISGGMKKRVGIARAIATKPKYILYDEPTTGLDPISTNEINSLIVTHEMSTVYNVVNKVIMLYKGEIIFEGSPEELKMSNDKYIKYFITGNKV